MNDIFRYELYHDGIVQDSKNALINRIQNQYYSIPHAKYRIHITNRNEGRQLLLYYKARISKMKKQQLISTQY